MSKMLGIDSDYTYSTNSSLMYRNIYLYNNFRFRFPSADRILKQRDLAIRSEVESAAAQPDVIYITGSGHGFYNNFQGNSLDEIIWSKKCPLTGGPQYAKEEVENKIIHLTSCKSARDLGPDMVEKGCSAFIGYTEDFIVSRSTIHCDCLIDISLSKGEDVETACGKAIAAYGQQRFRALSRNQIVTAAEIGFTRDMLRSPLNHETKWGNKNATLSS